MSQTPCDQLAVPYLENTSTTLYFTAPGSYGVAYTYMVDGSLASASTNFTVIGPNDGNGERSVAITSAVSTVQIINHVGMFYMSLGDSFTKTPGVVFREITSEHDGSFFWTQVVNQDAVNFFQPSGYYVCATGSGLDIKFIYGRGESVHDSPSLSLSNDLSANRSFSATMYLMWLYKDSGAIPVPVGNVGWGFNGAASLMNDSWEITSSYVPTPIVTLDNFDYPSWYSVESGDPVDCVLQ